MDFYSLEPDKMLSWARYLFWAEILSRRFKEFMESLHDVDNDAKGWTFFALMSQWYASLWVVIEGWQELQFKDNVLNGLISNRPDYCYLLKRYRNGVFHYQPRIIEERFLSFLREDEDLVVWIHNLHNEFLRFFWEWVDNFPGTESQQEEFFQSIIAIVGWVPTNILPARIKELEKLTQKAEDLLKTDNTLLNSKSDSLRAAIVYVKNILKESRKNTKNVLNLLKNDARNDN